MQKPFPPLQKGVSSLVLILGMLLWLSYQARRRADLLNICRTLDGETIHLEGYAVERSFRRIWLRGVSLEELKWPKRVAIQDPKGRISVGQQVSAKGRLDCRWPLRNPGSRSRMTPSLRIYEPEVLSLKSPWGVWGAYFSFKRVLSEIPAEKVRGLSLAVWSGDKRHLDEEMVSFYRSAGVFHLLALSGQHVWVLVGLTLLLFRLLCHRWGGLHALEILLPPLVCALLFFLSEGLPSVWRAGILFSVRACLRLLKWETTPLQLGCVAVAVALVLDPDALTTVGFLLSAMATLKLLWLWQECRLHSLHLRTLWVMVFLPVLLTPTTLCFFGTWNAWAPLYSLGLSLFWQLFWIPLGYLAPFIAFVSPLALELCEFVFREWNEGSLVFGKMISSPAIVLWRPTLWEWLWIEALMLSVFVAFRRLFWGSGRDELGCFWQKGLGQ